MSTTEDEAARLAGLDRTGYDLLLALAEPGCPVCTFVTQGVTRYLDRIAYDSVTALDVRLELQASLGYCAVHGQVWLAQQNAPGTAIIYEDLCNRLAAILAPTGDQAGSGAGLVGKLQQRLRGGVGGAGGRALARALEPAAPCPACRHAQTIEGEAVASATVALANPGFFAAYQAHPIGLCLPHFRAVLGRLNDAAVLRAVVGVQAAHLRATGVELAEVIRKADYRFRAEPPGAEVAAPARSVEQVGGRLPTQLNPPPTSRA